MKRPSAPAPSGGARRPAALPSADDEAVLDALPRAPLPKYLTPSEYLAMKDAERE